MYSYPPVPSVRFLAAVAFTMALGPAPAPAAVTDVLSYGLSPSTEPGLRNSEPAISANGRYVAFVSSAPNLVVGDTSTLISPPDVFVFDRDTDTTTLVSLDSTGVQGSEGGYHPAISNDGRYVAFISWSPELVPADLNNAPDVFIRDRVAGTTTRASLDSAGNEGDGECIRPTITPDGRWVAFWSHATNLVTGDTNGFWDVFLHDRDTGDTIRVSVDSAGAEMDVEDTHPWEGPPAVSADGRYVAFRADATNLVAGDTNGVADIFVRDTQTNVTTRVSVDSIAAQADGESRWQVISADGRFVAFASMAGNLVAGDTNELWDIFVHDRTSGATTRVSVDSAGNERPYPWATQPVLSADGRYVAFVAPDVGWNDIFVHDRTTATTTRVSVDSAGNQGHGHAGSVAMSADGRYVAFQSLAPDLVPGDTNGSLLDGGHLGFRNAINASDIFVHDRTTGTTERTPDVAAPPPPGALLLGDGSSVPNGPRAVSLDGRYVAFESMATNLVTGDSNLVGDIFVRDSLLGTTQRVSVDSLGNEGDGRSAYPSISANGRYVAFESMATNLVADDTNGLSDVFVRDRATGQTTRVSVDSAGNPGTWGSHRPSISADGQLVAFSSWSELVAGDLNGASDVFVRDRTAGTTTRVSVDSLGVEGDWISEHPAISGGGRFVAFYSWATNLVIGDTTWFRDVFVHDRTTGATTRVSVDSAGNEADFFSGVETAPTISADGRYVAFDSWATNLVAADTNGASDIFVHDRTTGATTRVSVDSLGNQGAWESFAPSITADGRYVAFESRAANLVPGDWWDTNDVFVHDRTTGVTIRASVDSGGNQGFWDRDSYSAAISPNGACVAFASESVLVPLDANGIADLFLHCSVWPTLNVFADGFESGNVSVWSSSVGYTP